MANAVREVSSIDREEKPRELIVRSKEIVIALVGYAGAGCSEVADKLSVNLKGNGYRPERIKLSKIIESFPNSEECPAVSDDASLRGAERLSRASHLQNCGDIVRKEYGADILIRKAIQEFKVRRDGESVGTEKIAFIIDSVKHTKEIELLSDLYGPSFRLLSVHCSKERRFLRLFGDANSDSKFAGALKKDVEGFMVRDEKDATDKKFGQQVRDAFYLGDYFLNNDTSLAGTSHIVQEVDRFISLLLGQRLIRPRIEESAMYGAFSAARHSSCLSRQVGATLYSPDNRLISNGANEVPKFGGGVYGEDDGSPERRCFGWVFDLEGGLEFQGCHNTRMKNTIQDEIANWMQEDFLESMVTNLSKRGKVVPPEFKALFKEGINASSQELSQAPRIGGLLEFSRSIHAEMDAVISAARAGHSTKNTVLFCTTYPCHNCARHMVTAGVTRVVYIEPYVKSMAVELHNDSISDVQGDCFDDDGKQIKVFIQAFTGVGPRMFDMHFKKNFELKDDSGKYIPPSGEYPIEGIRIDKLEENESRAIEMTLVQS